MRHFFRPTIPERRWTSMCMEIADFTHADCPAPPWCNCGCHKPTPEETP